MFMVREWVKRGLPTCLLILGAGLPNFLLKTVRRVRLANSTACGVAPRVPAGNMADYQPKTEFLGNLIGICPRCDCMMNRRVNVSKLEHIRGPFEVDPIFRTKIGPC